MESAASQTATGETAPPPLAKGLSRTAWLLIVLAALLLLIGGLWYWYHRPIRPVVLTEPEKTVVEAKVEAIQKPSEPVYEKGSKEIIFTERELNGLLNQNTTLGDSVRFELATGAVHARIETDLDPDLPLVGGKRLKARARFLVGHEPGSARLILDDLTIWGISLPNDWLGGLKGHNLLEEALGAQSGGIAGVEEFRVESGRLIIRLAE
jgi:hypothetical protein